MIYKVLSIDFDYFQDTTLETMFKCYPEPIDLVPKMSEIVWSTYYANANTKSILESIGIREKEYNFMMNLLKNKAYNTEVMISHSHKYIYDFVMSKVKLNIGDKLEIINIDMHPDFCNDCNSLDCGNWLGYLKEDLGNALDIKWIAPDETFVSQEKDLYVGDVSFLELNGIDGSYFDLIFLCRSDNWLAPHLDKYFVDMSRLLTSMSYNGLIEQGIEETRKIYDLQEFMKKVD